MAGRKITGTGSGTIDMNGKGNNTTGWKECRFRDLLIEPVRNGIYKKKELHGTGIRIVNMGELFANPRLFDIKMKRLILTEKEKEKNLLQNGDLIFARRSLTAEGAGKCSIVKEIIEETTFESSIIRARPDQTKVVPDFMYYFFNAPFGKYLLGTILRQVAVAGITGTDLMQLEIKLPPLPEQRAIAGILSSLDDKIDLLHRQNKTLEAMAEALFRQWFVEEKDEGWEVKKLGDIATVQNGYAFSSKDYIEFQPGNLEVFKMGHIKRGGGLRINPKRDYVQREEKLKRWILNKDDIVMAMTDMKDNVVILGVPAMVDKDDIYVLNQRVARLHLKTYEILNVTLH